MPEKLLKEAGNKARIGKQAPYDKSQGHQQLLEKHIPVEVPF